MTMHGRVRVRRQEQAALRQQIVNALIADARVCAAWLFGSVARGEADDLSDLDLWVVVEDAQLGPIIHDRQAYVARTAEPVLRLSVWGNAPPYGAYMLVQYPGETGPHQVDWYWQPRSRASVPDGMHMLFDRVGLPRTAGDLPIWTRGDMYRPRGALAARTPAGRIAAISGKITFFWAMAPIIAKSIVRGYDDTVAFLLEDIRWKRHEISWLLGRAPLPTRHLQADRARLAAQTRDAQFASLREEIAAAKQLTQPITRYGATVPTAAIPYIDRFLEFTQDLTNSM